LSAVDAPSGAGRRATITSAESARLEERAQGQTRGEAARSARRSALKRECRRDPADVAAARAAGVAIHDPTTCRLRIRRLAFQAANPLDMHDGVVCVHVKRDAAERLILRLEPRRTAGARTFYLGRTAALVCRTSSAIWSTSAASLSNARSSRRRCHSSTTSRSPYRSPSQSRRCASIRRSVPP